MKDPVLTCQLNVYEKKITLVVHKHATRKMLMRSTVHKMHTQTEVDATVSI